MLEKYISLFPEETHFFTDGIINQEKFNKANERILWILKEPWTGESHETIKISDYIKYINEFDFNSYPQYDTSTPMWRKITYTNSGILSGGWLFNDLEDLPQSKDVFDSLFNCALINLKKVPGSTRSNFYNIDNYFRIAQEFIFNQIEEINPTVIICGGTYNHLMPLIKNELKPVNDESLNDFGLWKNRLIINAYHPSYTIGYEAYTNFIVNAYNTWKAIK
jgi:hypothetical protein